MRLKNVGVCGVAATSWNRHSSTDQPLLPRAGTASAAVLGTNPTAAAAIAVSTPSRRTIRGRVPRSLVTKLAMIFPLGGERPATSLLRKHEGKELIRGSREPGYARVHAYAGRRPTDPCRPGRRRVVAGHAAILPGPQDGPVPATGPGARNHLREEPQSRVLHGSGVARPAP